jgi:hypothetical protein
MKFAVLGQVIKEQVRLRGVMVETALSPRMVFYKLFKFCYKLQNLHPLEDMFIRQTCPSDARQVRHCNFDYDAQN